MFHAAYARIQVRVAHSDPVVAAGLATLLEREGDIDVLDDSIALPAVVRDAMRAPNRTDVVIADYTRAMALAAMRPPSDALQPRLMVLTAHDREQDVRSALEAGVDGYVELGCASQELVAGVRQLARGSRFLSALAARRVADSMSRSRLTGRERQVLGLVADGKSNKAIAIALDISAGTVKTHMKGILGKLAAGSRTQAATIARERGLISADSTIV
ncbi:LuxR C-terminal-related transcriptional regulator [Roseateles sp. So40a]|uniref:LuxR C-terminal-related transcriptional regulator n=1 Tax=Roseateles sp. So40a TaxID=3400226 RepID=UPI003A8C31DB